MKYSVQKKDPKKFLPKRRKGRLLKRCLQRCVLSKNLGRGEDFWVKPGAFIGRFKTCLWGTWATSPNWFCLYFFRLVLTENLFDVLYSLTSQTSFEPVKHVNLHISNKNGRMELVQNELNLVERKQYFGDKVF